MKQCSQCKKEGRGPKPLSDFCKGSDRDGLQGMCREHTRAYSRAWVKNNPEKNRAKGARFRKNNPRAYRSLWVKQNLKSNYGLTVQEYQDLLDSQSGKCAICAIDLVSQIDPSRPLLGQPANNIGRVDHCHSTNTVRGILCFGCNVGLGKFKDDEDLMLVAVRYLRASRATAEAISRVQHVNLQAEVEPRKRDLEISSSRESRRSTLSPFLLED